jgi:Flp pilus assembly protein CpaB
MSPVTLIAAIAAIAVVALALALAVSVGRKHRVERHEVENMFSTESDRTWWEERR